MNLIVESKRLEPYDGWLGYIYILLNYYLFISHKIRDSNTHSQLQPISWSLSSELSKIFNGSLHFSIEFDNSWI